MVEGEALGGGCFVKGGGGWTLPFDEDGGNGEYLCEEEDMGDCGVEGEKGKGGGGPPSFLCW